MSAPTPAAAPPPVATDLVHQFFVLLKAAAVYARDNELYAKPAAAARELIAKALAAEGSILLETGGERLFFNKLPIRFPAGGYAGGRFLMDEMRRRGVGG